MYSPGGTPWLVAGYLCGTTTLGAAGPPPQGSKLPPVCKTKPGEALRFSNFWGSQAEPRFGYFPWLGRGSTARGVAVGTLLGHP